jgi:hypothetical protein
LPLRETNMKRQGFAAIVVIFLVVLSVFGYLGYKYLKSPPGPLPSESATVSPTVIPTVPPKITLSKLYSIKISLKTETNIPKLGYGTESPGFEKFDDYLESVLKLSPGSISQIIFDFKTTSPYGDATDPFNGTYFITLNKEVTLDKNYSDSFVTIAVSPESYSLLPFLVKNDYCEKDADCNLTSDVCTYGAFNNYRKYIDPPWGCGPGGYKDNYDWFKWGEIDPEMGCAVELKFEGSVCQNNQCSETGMKKSCLEGAP